MTTIQTKNGWTFETSRGISGTERPRSAHNPNYTGSIGHYIYFDLGWSIKRAIKYLESLNNKAPTSPAAPAALVGA